MKLKLFCLVLWSIPAASAWFIKDPVESMLVSIVLILGVLFCTFLVMMHPKEGKNGTQRGKR
jgi:CHASE2 domain-containing sensor protein